MEMLIDKEEYQFYLENDILFFKYLVSHVTFELAVKILDDKISIVNNKQYLTILDTHQVKTIENSAKKIMASSRGLEGISKCAIITNSIVQKVIVNFFLILEKPQVPTKIFNDYAPAMAWLNKK
jgi:hypothetical protein